MLSSIRLSSALEWIDSNDILADIGCDHGYLAIAALNKGIEFVQLIDNKQGPLDVAYQNLDKNGLLNQQNVLLTLSDGLDLIDEKINTVAILGMGGELISRILENGKTKINNIDKFILEANTKINFLREYLFNNNYLIISEKIVKENNKYYELLLVKKSDQKPNFDQKDIMFGPILRTIQPELFKEKWLKIFQKYQTIIKTSTADVPKIKAELTLIKEVLNIQE